MAPKVILQKVMTSKRSIERSQVKIKWHHRIPWTLKSIDLDVKIVIFGALDQKLYSKTSFCKIVTNVTRSHTSHGQTAQHIFQFVSRTLTSSYTVVKFGDNCPSGNGDMAQSVI